MTDVLLRAFWAPLTETYFQKALIGGCLVAIVAGAVGCLVVLRRMAFLGDALSHAMIAGVAGGYLVMKLLFGYEAHALGMLLGSLLAAVITVALIGFVSRISRIKEDTAIGIMYTGVFALGVVVVSIFRSYIHIDLMHFIMGDILGVADSDLWVSAFVSAGVLTVLILFFRHFQLATFDPIMAASIGLPVLLIDYALTTCVSLVVVSAVSMVGVILVVGLLITPAATAYLLSDRLDRMMALAALFGVTSVIGGLYLCVWLDSAGGGAVMLFGTLQFLVVLTVAPRYGLLARWLRLRRLVPQTVVEDVLTTMLRHEGETPLTVIRQFVQQHVSLPKALRQMEQDGLISAAPDGYRLTEIGLKEGRQVLRAHRLWETYLASIGTPQEDLHFTADRMEHVRADGTVDYLDEKLGKPVLDPHGKEIPPRQNNIHNIQ
ncbi:MAG: metal ABC transporter permease [Verrucomicrobia bacterium]|nr:metal ABC transporter permease [Deltaproteobacteria bacterium]